MHLSEISAPELPLFAARVGLSAAAERSRGSGEHHCILVINAEGRLLATADDYPTLSCTEIELLPAVSCFARLCIEVDGMGCEHAPELTASSFRIGGPRARCALPIHRGELLIGAIGVGSYGIAPAASVAEAGRTAILATLEGDNH